MPVNRIADSETGRESRQMRPDGEERLVNRHKIGHIEGGQCRTVWNRDCRAPPGELETVCGRYMSREGEPHPSVSY